MPIVGVIEPGAEAAVAIAKRLSDAGDPRGGRTGVLGTTRTIASGAYVRAVAGRSSRIEVIGQAAPLLVPLVEEGWLEGDVPRLAVERYVRPLIAAVGGGLARRPIEVVASADATAVAVSELLRSRELSADASSEPALDLLVTDYPASFAAMTERCLGAPAPDVAEMDI